MFNKKSTESNLDYKKLNEVISTSKRILNIAYVFIIIVAIYAITLIFKEWKIGTFILNLLKIVSPLFIGLVIAWLLDPVVRGLKKHKVSRPLATSIVYFILLIILIVIISSLIPVLTEQANEVVKSIPSILSTLKEWINDIFNKLNNIEGIDVSNFKNGLFNKLEVIGSDLTSNLPSFTVKAVSSIFSGLGSLLIGFIIGFYLLMSFDNASDVIKGLVPVRFKDSFNGIITEINTSLRKYVQGTLICATSVFVLSTIGFFIAGLKAPILFGLFCGITNIIPYAGPYIGGVPAVLVGFSQGPVVGFITLISIVIAQFLESNILNPIVMSKTMKLHPVTIILGLLIFGHFWGIIGMLVATPSIAIIKSIVLFLDDKYDILSFN